MRKKEFIPMNLQLFAEPPAGGDGDAGDTSATGGKSGEGSNKADPDVRAMTVSALQNRWHSLRCRMQN